MLFPLQTCHINFPSVRKNKTVSPISVFTRRKTIILCLYAILKKKTTRKHFKKYVCTNISLNSIRSITFQEINILFKASLSPELCEYPLLNVNKSNISTRIRLVLKCVDRFLHRRYLFRFDLSLNFNIRDFLKRSNVMVKNYR